mgnify:FL=1
MIKQSRILAFLDVASFVSVFIIIIIASIEFLVSRIFQTTGIPSSIRLIEQGMIADRKSVV